MKNLNKRSLFNLYHSFNTTLKYKYIYGHVLENMCYIVKRCIAPVKLDPLADVPKWGELGIDSTILNN